MKMNKQPIGKEPGIYFNLSNEEYHDDPAIGSSDIKKLLESPLEYWYNSSLNKERCVNKFEHLTYGSALHCYLMEEHKFDDEFIVLPEYKDMKIDSDFYNKIKDHPNFEKDFELPKTKTAKQFKYIGSKPSLSTKDLKSIKDAVSYLKSRDIPSQIFSNGYPEVSIFWRDEATSLMCKCRHDYLNVRYSADYKSIADLKKLKSQTQSYGYYISSAFYLEGLKEVKKIINNNKIECPEGVREEWWNKFLKIEHDRFILVFQEKIAPYRIRCRNINQEVHDIAHDKIRFALDIYKSNIEKYGIDQWPDNEDGEIITLDLYDLPYIQGVQTN